MTASLSHAHQHVYDAIMRHPSAHNVQWHDVRSMLGELAHVVQEADGTTTVRRNGRMLVLTADRHKDVSTDEQMREWLPKLVGVERSLLFRLHDGSEVRCAVEAAHASQLTRENVTAAVHFIEFHFTPEQVAAFG